MSYKSKTINYCPVCNKYGVRFNPLPDIYASNAKNYGYKYFGTGEMTALKLYSCSDCGASDRERIYAYYLKERFNESDSFKFFHFAPEKNLRNLIVSNFPEIDYKTFDKFQKDVDLQADLTDLSNINNNECDFFICSHVLEHIPDDKSAISELYRVLKPGGTGILMAPISMAIEETIENIPEANNNEARWKYFGQGDHVRLYSKKDFINRIISAGFLLHQLDERYFGKQIFKSLGLKKSSVLYIVEK